MQAGVHVSTNMEAQSKCMKPSHANECHRHLALNMQSTVQQNSTHVVQSDDRTSWLLLYVSQQPHHCCCERDTDAWMHTAQMPQHRTLTQRNSCHAATYTLTSC